MNKINFYKYNLILGVICGLISITVFTLTVEPTASYWDCAEYISTSAKLQVGHPPGAPLFQMLGAIFSIFASDLTDIAFAINMMSVISSSLTIVFLFWSISYIAKSILNEKVFLSKDNAIKIFGSSFLGSLTFTFTDSFWFNAVEAEVYAMATMILALLFYLGLKWMDDFDNERSDKWLILISFIIGLSFGVHFMGLLAIPSIGLMYYFKSNRKYTIKGFVTANIASIGVLLFIFKLLLPSTLSLFGYLEVFFVNDLRLPFNSGTIAGAVLLISVIYYGLKVSSEKKFYITNRLLLCMTFIFIGFSSWLMIPIRSNANTVINENSPSDARSLLAYYNLEQYPDTYLFYGPMFSDVYSGQDEDNPYRDDIPKYERDYNLNRYKIVNDWENGKINSNSKHMGFFPRMWSSDNAKNYLKYFGYLDFEIKKEFRNNQQIIEIVGNFKSRVENDEVDSDDYHGFLTDFGNYLDIEKPSLVSNIGYFINFQLSKMYFRYFMWNFSGKQNDKQWKYNLENGNWLSGIKALDEFRLGSQDNLPFDVLNNKGRNQYYMIPFFLGLIGLIFVFKKSFKTVWAIFLLFIFTGIALKFYLNERIFEPRERDYALVGSFYSYSIFIGLSFLALANFLLNYLKKNISYLIVVIITISSPILLALNNWDDHDRSNRYTAQTLAKAYLNSIDKDKQAMIFTVGDNDTFALWYAQEIENHRTDVRTINTSLLATDWYIDQMKRKAYESKPIKSNLNHDQYAYGNRDYIKYESIIDSVRWDLNDFINWISSDNKRTQYKFLLEQYGYDENDLSKIPKSTQNMIYYPTNKVRFFVNKENVKKSGILGKEDHKKIVDYIDIDLPKSGLYKNQILMLDILSKNDWERPIYFTGGSFKDSEYIWMKEYLQLDGLVYKLVPIKTEINKDNPYQMGRIDPLRMYNIVKSWEWGNSESQEIYHDIETRKNSISFRGNLHRLAKSFIEIGDFDKAKEIMDLSFEKMPIEFFEYYSLSEPYINSYQEIGEKEKAEELYKFIENKYLENIKYYHFSIKNNLKNFPVSEFAESIFTNTERYRNLIESEIDRKNYSNASKSIAKFINYTSEFEDIYGSYEYNIFLKKFIEPLYLSKNNSEAKLLYNKITNQFKSRLKTIINAKSDANSTYLTELFNNELEAAYELLLIIKNYDSKEFYENELEEFNNLKDEFNK